MRVDINLANVLAVFEEWHHDFGLYMNAACDIVGLGLDIRHDEVFIGDGNLTTNSFSKWNDGMIGWLSSKRSQFELLFVGVGEIKPYPIIIGDFI